MGLGISELGYGQQQQGGLSEQRSGSVRLTERRGLGGSNPLRSPMELCKLYPNLEEALRRCMRSTGRDNYPGGLGICRIHKVPIWLRANWDMCFGIPTYHHQASFPRHSFRERN